MASSQVIALNASSFSSSSLNVTWHQPSQPGGSILYYEVQWSYDNFVTTIGSNTIYAPQQSCVVSGLSPSTQYNIRVSAFNGVAPGVPNTVNATTLSASPDNVSSVGIIGPVLSAGFMIGWTSPSYTGSSSISEYRVEWDTNNSFSTVPLPFDNTSSTSYSLTGLSPSTDYWVRITAINTNGLESSGTVFGPTQTASGGGGGSTIIMNQPSIGSGNSITATFKLADSMTTINSLELRTTANTLIYSNVPANSPPESNPGGYGVSTSMGYTNSAGNYYFIPTISPGSLPSGDYILIVVDSNSTQLTTDSVQFTAGGGGGGGVITGTSATAGSSGQLNVSWSFPVGYTATSTVVYYTTNNAVTSVGDLAGLTINIDYFVVFPASPTSTSDTISGLTNGVTYYLIVDSVDMSSGSTATSARFSGTPSAGGGGGGGSGDPYITTVGGTSYKLPIMNGAIRMYQGEVAGKTLTVNATLRTQSSKDLMVHNLRSAIELSKTMNSKKAEMFMKSICEKEETLCFFESFYIQHAEKVLAVNVWDGKLKVQHYTGGFKTLAHKNGDVALKASGIYSKYSGSTLEVEVAAGASVFLSVYNSPMVRSGLFVNVPAMTEGNGVIVNMLSSADMTLTAVDCLTGVPRRDTKVLRTKKEMFADHDGTRVRNIVMTC